MELFSYLSVSLLLFLRRVYGLAVKPYSTVRSIADKGLWGELFYVGLVASAFFAFSALVKTPSLHPLLLTKQFVLLALGAFFGYLTIIISFYVFLLTTRSKEGKFQGLAVAWGYSLIPTVIWFFMTSWLYILLPPPRTQSLLGVLFSLVYLTISAVLFFWKAELYFLTLRFGLRFNLYKITLVTLVILPIVGVYSVIMLYFGIFRVPFI